MIIDEAKEPITACLSILLIGLIFILECITFPMLQKHTVQNGDGR